MEQQLHFASYDSDSSVCDDCMDEQNGIDENGKTSSSPNNIKQYALRPRSKISKPYFMFHYSELIKCDVQIF